MKRSEHEAHEAEGNAAPAENAPTGAGGSGFLVKRDRLLRELGTRGREAGISIVCAPKGFGKTALLLQYVAEVRSDPSRGISCLVEAGSLSLDEFERDMGRLDGEMEPVLHPLIAIDDLPVWGAEDAAQAAATLRSMRSRGFELVIACEPSCRAFLGVMGDTLKLGAQALRVHPREYSEWAKIFSISSALDVYDLTQGIPALVVLLRSMSDRGDGAEVLERGVADLYRSVLESLRQERDPLYRMACLFILVGSGSVSDFERCGLRVRAETLTRMAHDYPVFGYEPDTRSFRCMGGRGAEMEGLCKDIAARRPAFALKAVRTLLKVGRVDRAVDLATLLLGTREAVEVIEQFPTQFALGGHAVYVSTVLSRLVGEDAASVPVGVLLAAYLAALTSGEYRTARSMCTELRRHAREIERDIDPRDWVAALALSSMWGNCTGTELPSLSPGFTQGRESEAARRISAHVQLYRMLIAGDGAIGEAELPDMGTLSSENEVDVPLLMLACDRILFDALHGTIEDSLACDRRLQELVKVLTSRRLVPIAARVRMTAATCRLMAGLPLADERAFTDAGTTAVRESDFPTQLYCLLAEGWQSLGMGQVVNARFRAQQILKLSDESQTFLRSWAALLERSAFVVNTSRVTVGEEAELLDLSKEECTPAEAWTVALHLSAAHYDSELSAWYSLHKAALVDKGFFPLARLAMQLIGERADSVRRLLPRRLQAPLLHEEDEAPRQELLFDVVGAQDFTALGQVHIGLFGGFHVQRNGHTLTNEVWRRKKASVLAARLVLAMGSFVSRRVITEEMWPKLGYARARDNLYVTLTSLRAAFGQQLGGPQYVLVQGEGVALNSEFVSSDVARFDLLARDVLLRRAGVSGQQILESCLKIEQMYAGPLFVPESGDTAFFVRMRRAYLSRFIDCMIRGVEVALEIDDVRAASWLVEAALRQAPLREDVIRQAMRVYDLAGRRREIVELYNSHIHYLEQELNSMPEEETRVAYENIIGRAKFPVLI